MAAGQQRRQGLALISVILAASHAESFVLPLAPPTLTSELGLSSPCGAQGGALSLSRGVPGRDAAGATVVAAATAVAVAGERTAKGTHVDSASDGSLFLEESVPDSAQLLAKGKAMYLRRFAKPDPALVTAAFAPGRVNLIGEHTDYNEGFVMPLALERGTVVYGTGRLVDVRATTRERQGPSQGCRVMSDNVGGEAVSFKADASLSPGKPAWANYIKGVVAEYLEQVPPGKELQLDACVVGTVPIGGGVSSSASLSVAFATFVEGVLQANGVAPPKPTVKAHRCRLAEHKFLSTPCGIMDQFVTAMAEPGHAMLLDCRSQQPELVPLTDPDLAVVVTNSHVTHSLSQRGSQYPVRVQQCQAAVRAINARHPHVQSLRDASEEQVEEIRSDVEDVVYRRAKHVVSENARTLGTAAALEARDYGMVGQNMLQSHRSLREDYEVSCDELDVLVDLAMEVEGVYGSRLTGAGFGGCTVTLVQKGAVDSLVRHIRREYKQSTGLDCSCFVTQPGHGARTLDAGGGDGGGGATVTAETAATIPDRP